MTSHSFFRVDQARTFMPMTLAASAQMSLFNWKRGNLSPENKIHQELLIPKSNKLDESRVIYLRNFGANHWSIFVRLSQHTSSRNQMYEMFRWARSNRIQEIT